MMVLGQINQSRCSGYEICYEDNFGKQQITSCIGKTGEDAEESFKERFKGKYKQIISVKEKGALLY